SGQSNSQVFDYHVTGSVTINTGGGIANQINPNFVGVENGQTFSGSGTPVIGGNVSITGVTQNGPGPLLQVLLGPDGAGGNFPLIIGRNLSIGAIGTGSAVVNLNDLNVANGATSVSFSGSTRNISLLVQGSSINSVFNS